MGYAGETVDKMLELRSIVNGLNRTVSGERARVANLVDVEFSRLRPVINVALSKSEATVSESICGVWDDFTVESTENAVGRFLGGSSG